MSVASPRVSVVMIFRDAGRFIDEAVGSVLAQSYEDWELVLVDDGSTDASSRKAREYARCEPTRIRCVEHAGHANLGMSASRNAGIAASSGELVAFLDADDVWRPEKLERQVVLLDEHPDAAMVYGATEHWYSWTGRPEDRGRDVRRRLGVPPDTLVPPPRLVPLFLGGEAQTPGTCGVLVRRDAVVRVGGFEPIFRGMFEDQVFLAKLCLRESVFVEGGSWDRYRQHPDSHSARARAAGQYRSKRPSPATLAYLTWLEEYVAAEGLRDAGVDAALRLALRPYGRSPGAVASRIAGWLDDCFERLRRRTGASATGPAPGAPDAGRDDAT